MSKSSFCTECGTENTGKFCANCGANVATQSKPLVVDTAKSKVAKRFSLSQIVGLALVVLAFGLGAFGATLKSESAQHQSDGDLNQSRADACAIVCLGDALVVGGSNSGDSVEGDHAAAVAEWAQASELNSQSAALLVSAGVVFLAGAGTLSVGLLRRKQNTKNAVVNLPSDSTE
jgi:RNA polymerase subunit RPABC4/transcription elongation factor Spt4